MLKMVYYLMLKTLTKTQLVGLLSYRVLCKRVTIANVYAPNDSRATFFKAFFQILDKYNSPHLLLGGDFNLVAHSALDLSRAGSTTNAFPKTLKTLLHAHNLVDSWRAHNVGHLIQLAAEIGRYHKTHY